jgi:hypothetical protein
MSGRARLVAAGVVVAAVLAAGGTFLSGRLISPQQAAASARPPARGPVTTRVERRVLASTVVTRGRLSSAGTLTVRPAPAVTGPDSVVTQVAVRAGQRLSSGTLIADVAGQPLIAAALPFGLYRDLMVGDSGPDVRALTGVLQRARLLTGRHDRVDAVVVRAVSVLLRRCGYPLLAGQLGLPPAVRGPAAAAGGSNLDASGAEGAVVPGRIERRWFQQVPAAASEVGTVTVRVGTVLSGADVPLLTLRSGTATVDAVLDPARRGLVTVGTRATVSNDSTGASVHGVVRSVASAVRTAPSGDTGLPVVVGLDVGAATSSLSGTDVRVSFTSASATAGLAVPTAAVYTDLDGRSTLRRADGQVVVVTVGTCVSGWCPVQAGGLREGQLIVIDDGPR